MNATHTASPLAPEVVERASLWLARLWSETVTAEDIAACERWRAAHPDHERAWARLGVIGQKFQALESLESLPPRVAFETLTARPSPRVANAGRRRALRVFGGVITLAGAGYTLRRSPMWDTVVADYATGVGEVRQVTLADGTRLWLDTASAVDVRFSPGERRIALRRGRICVETGAARHGTPLVVATRQGEIRDIGTRFTVRDDGNRTQVAVFDGIVLVQPTDGTRTQRLDAGQAASFSSTDIDPADASATFDENAAAWTRAQLIVERMRLGDLVDILARYRRGILRCDAAVADLRVSGVFSLADTDRALSSLAVGLPVETVYRTRYWVTVKAR
ncbi:MULTISPECIES: FecR domain-containing protein [Pandoraea]|uniref:FecR domain-containing protein n=1 Tax=Pandoraea TaxID=93217 RepID=UPI001F5E0E5D|nr:MULTISPECIES: FecR domain-containing protein [Pandoraea]MCI3207861.1 iron dicitrate transport regulator FecR [Pandoraea sp. LA3]MDN4585890.1 iron dicitrate transport regulator FecR [Pandoraea capi]